jgi:hypothetical protein
LRQVEVVISQSRNPDGVVTPSGKFIVETRQEAGGRRQKGREF